jgi:hypothetical protein
MFVCQKRYLSLRGRTVFQWAICALTFRFVAAIFFIYNIVIATQSFRLINKMFSHNPQLRLQEDMMVVILWLSTKGLITAMVFAVCTVRNP